MYFERTTMGEKFYAKLEVYSLYPQFDNYR